MNYKHLNDYEIVYRIRENDDDAVEIMLEKYEPIIMSFARKYYSQLKYHGVELSDVVQEGRIAVIKAINSYDPDGQTKFYTYVSICIDRHLITYCRNITAAKNLPLNYSVTDDCLYVIGDISNEPSTFLMRQYEEELFIKGKNILDFRDSNILELRYNGFSYKEISRLLDLPFSTVDSRLCKIRKTLQGMKDKF